MCNIGYVRSNNEPVKVAWKNIGDPNILHLFLNDKIEPLTIKLNKSGLNTANIVAKYQNRIVGSGKPYELGNLKKRALKEVYHIKFIYKEVN
jgi:hypothetical protein